MILNNNIIEDVTVHEHLGLTLSSNLSWRAHILKIHQKASTKLNLRKQLKYKLNRYTLKSYSNPWCVHLWNTLMWFGMDVLNLIVTC